MTRLKPNFSLKYNFSGCQNDALRMMHPEWCMRCFHRGDKVNMGFDFIHRSEQQINADTGQVQSKAPWTDRGEKPGRHRRGLSVVSNLSTCPIPHRILKAPDWHRVWVNSVSGSRSNHRSIWYKSQETPLPCSLNYKSEVSLSAVGFSVFKPRQWSRDILGILASSSADDRWEISLTDELSLSGHGFLRLTGLHPSYSTPATDTGLLHRPPAKPATGHAGLINLEGQLLQQAGLQEPRRALGDSTGGTPLTATQMYG